MNPQSTLTVETLAALLKEAEGLTFCMVCDFAGDSRQWQAHHQQQLNHSGMGFGYAMTRPDNPIRDRVAAWLLPQLGAGAPAIGNALAEAGKEFLLALAEQDEADSFADYEGPGDDDTAERAAVLATRRARAAELSFKKALLAWNERVGATEQVEAAPLDRPWKWWPPRDMEEGFFCTTDGGRRYVWCEGAHLSEAEAIAVRDALNRVGRRAPRSVDHLKGLEQNDNEAAAEDATWD